MRKPNRSPPLVYETSVSLHKDDAEQANQAVKEALHAQRCSSAVSLAGALRARGGRRRAAGWGARAGSAGGRAGGRAGGIRRGAWGDRELLRLSENLAEGCGRRHQVDLVALACGPTSAGGVGIDGTHARLDKSIQLLIVGRIHVLVHEEDREVGDIGGDGTPSDGVRITGRPIAAVGGGSHGKTKGRGREGEDGDDMGEDHDGGLSERRATTRGISRGTRRS